jgi:hypothetical protein
LFQRRKGSNRHIYLHSFTIELNKVFFILYLLADAQDLKSWVAQAACGFDSRPRHNQFNDLATARRIVAPAMWDHRWDHSSHDAETLAESMGREFLKAFPLSFGRGIQIRARGRNILVAERHLHIVQRGTSF